VSDANRPGNVAERGAERGNERGEARGEGRRGPRPERDRRPDAVRETATTATAEPAQTFVDTLPGDAAETADNRGDRQGGRRRRRRGGRDRDEARDASVPQAGADSFEGARRTDEAMPEPVPGDITRGEAMPGERDGQGPRRDRGGRDRARRDDASPSDVPRDVSTAQSEPQATPWWTGGAEATSSPSLPEAKSEAVTVQPAPAPLDRSVRSEPLSEPVAPAPVTPAPAVAEPFVLATDQLAAVAQSAGLEWVNSDAEKIRAAQEALASEAPPARIPRERKSAATLDEGPLVLVETRKDLSQFKLPFETSGQATPGQH